MIGTTRALKLFSFIQAGRTLGVDRQTVADMVEALRLPYVDRGNAKLIDEDAVAILRDRLRPLSVAS